MSAITETSICNEALVFLGERPLLTFPETSVNSDYCVTFFNRVKESELIKHPWNFATDRIQLTRISGAPVYEYAYQYQIPANLLKILEMYPHSLRWRRERTSILSDSDTMYCTYIYNVSVSAFNAMFASVVSARLAMLLAPILTERDVKFTQAVSWYQDVVKDAKQMDNYESSIDQMDDLDVVSGRSHFVSGYQRATISAS